MVIRYRKNSILWLSTGLGLALLLVLLGTLAAIQPVDAASPRAAFSGRAVDELRPLNLIGDGLVRPDINYTYTVPTLLLSNEAPGYLINNLIAQGHGNQTLFEVLGYLKVQSGTIISDAFYTQASSAPEGSEIFLAQLFNYAGLNGAVEISADGTVHIRAVRGQDYDGEAGYLTTLSQDGQFVFTYGEGPARFIYTGSMQVQVGPNVYTYKYLAFAIAWGDLSRLFLPVVIR